MKELHKREDIEAIGQWLSGSRRYFLQNYKESEQVIRPVFTSYSREQLENFQQILRKTIPQVEIRGYRIGILRFGVDRPVPVAEMSGFAFFARADLK